MIAAKIGGTLQTGMQEPPDETPWLDQFLSEGNCHSAMRGPNLADVHESIALHSSGMASVENADPATHGT